MTKNNNLFRYHLSWWLFSTDRSTIYFYSNFFPYCQMVALYRHCIWLLKYNLCCENDLNYMGLGLWCLTPLSKQFQLFRGGQIYWWRKPKYPVKTMHRPAESHWQTFLACCIEYISPWTGIIELTMLIVNPTTIQSRPRRPS